MTERARLGAVTGRFQPVHDQHLELFGWVLDRHEHLVVAVTNPDTAARHQEQTSAHRHTDAANPFTYFERSLLLDAALRGAGLRDRATIVPFDLTRPRLWHEYVPAEAVQVVRVFTDWERSKAATLQAAYPVTVLDGDPDARLCATEIRARLTRGCWRDAVPPATVGVLRRLLVRTPMRERG